jgi:hypothetical protein
MDAKTIKNLKILAVRDTINPSYESQYRSICRWFSTTFSVPLPEVEAMPDEYVLRHYYEHIYGELYASENKNEFIKIAYTLLPGAEAEIEEIAEEDDEWEKQMLEDLKKEQEKEMASQKHQEKPNLNEEPEQVVRSYDDFYKEPE